MTAPRAPGSTLPPALAQRLASGGWLRTAHRGAPQVAPGNTARSLAAAAEIGVDLVEVDVRRTADGALALWHDPDVHAGGRRLEIAATPLLELQRAVERESGEELLDLAGGARAVAGRAGLMIDLKGAGLAEEIVATLRACAVDTAVICGELWDDLRAARRLHPAIGTSLTLGVAWSERRAGPRLDDIDTDAVTVSWNHVDASFVRRCHERGIAVLVWTVDRPARMRRLLQLGVDGLTSNRPDLLAGLARRRT